MSRTHSRCKIISFVTNNTFNLVFFYKRLKNRILRGDDTGVMVARKNVTKHLLKNTEIG